MSPHIQNIVQLKIFNLKNANSTFCEELNLLLKIFSTLLAPIY